MTINFIDWAPFIGSIGTFVVAFIALYNIKNTQKQLKILCGKTQANTGGCIGDGSISRKRRHLSSKLCYIK